VRCQTRGVPGEYIAVRPPGGLCAGLTGDITMRVLVDGDRGYIGSVFIPVVQGAGRRSCCQLVRRLGHRSRPGRLRQPTPGIRNATPNEQEEFDAIIHFPVISNDPIGLIRILGMGVQIAPFRAFYLGKSVVATGRPS